ncbi:YveK family protein [Oribacterium sp. FC2011]|uniref:YveK family protein n=1 Tax=Oribacterium sp. FC2011 TaxID=1408311 RepID=UPI0009DDE09C|nr:Wzz/FepE/Etk N-terminal domain-containing protein [Oribacterium sp. FC2011]
MPDNTNTNNLLQPNNLVAINTLDDDDDDEIDLAQIFFELKKNILFLVMALILGGGIGYSISKFVLVPTYTSTSMIYVMSKETTLTSLADLQIGSQLTSDYKVLVTSRTVMEDVIKKLNIDNMDYLDLRRKITLENPQNTRILNISVLDTDPTRAKHLTDAVSECASDYIADIMEQDPPKIIEYGEIPLKKTGPHNGRNALIAAAVFFMITAGFIVISTITNDTIRTEDDIENYFNLPVLAAIPEKDPEAAKKADQYNYAYRKKEKK